MSAHPEAQLEDITQHVEWVRELARALVTDPDVAEDVSQEAIMAALLQPPGAIRSMRNWLSGTVRNLSTDRLRRDLRRRRRETEAASRTDLAPSTAEIYERMAAHREVVDALLGLPEHYRVVLVLRYFEGEMPSRIAERLGMPVASVKTRLQRALQQLRQQLDERGGGTGRAWIGVLVPILRDPAPAMVPGSLGILTLCAAVAGVLAWVAFVFWDWPQGSAPGHELGRPQVAAGDRAASQTTSTGAIATAGPVRSVVGGAWRDELLANDLNDGPAPVSGSVFRDDGTAAPGVVVQWEPSRPGTASGLVVAVSDAGGSFEFEPRGGSGWITALGERYATVFAGRAGGERRRGLTLVVAERAALRGRVLDEHGAAVRDASLRVVLPADFTARFAGGLDASIPFRHETRSDATGGFAFDGLPRIEGAVLAVDADGYLPGPRLPLGSRSESWEPRLQRLPSDGPGVLTGRVVDSQGLPLSHARVGTGFATAWTDADGSFRVAFDPAGEPLLLAVCATGKAPVQRFVDRARWQEVVMERAATEIEGRVLDAEGRPLAGVDVFVADATVLGRGRPATNAHDGLGIEHDLLDDPRIDGPDYPELAEARLAGRPDEPWHMETTDRDGRFLLAGLAWRDYEVVALDPMNLAEVRRSIAGGQRGVELRFASASSHRAVNGTLRDVGDRPVAGARIELAREVFRIAAGGRDLLRQRHICQIAHSDQDGRFAVRDVPPGDYLLHVTAPGVFSATVPLDALDELRMIPRTRLRVEGAPPRFDTVQTIDAAGTTLALGWEDGRSRSRSDRAPLPGGNSRVLEIDSRSEFLLLTGPGGVSQRIAIRPDPSRVVIVRP